MKLTNYNYGAVMPQSSTWYRGKISMTANEWRDVQIHLFKSATLKRMNRAMRQFTEAGFATMLREDIARRVKTRDGYRLTVRVSATDEIVRAFVPQRAGQYKRQNYFIEVTTK